MNLIKLVWHEFIGLFVDDGSLAIAILSLVAGLAVLVKLDIVGGLAAGTILFVGLVAILAENLRRSARRLAR